MVLDRTRQSNLTFKPSKVVICPKSTVILGWQKNGSKWFPTEHVLSPLAQAEPPSTVKKLRGWLGAYRQIAKTIPNHAVVLKNFEKMVGGKNSRDKIVWTPDLIAEFDAAKKSVATSAPITIPRNSDKLKIYPDWSQDADAVGGRLIIERVVNGKKIDLNGGEFSCRLKGAQSRWTPCEKECLGIKLLVQHYQPYIRESIATTTIFTDNIVSVHAWNAIKLGKISSSSRVASFISTMCENTIEILHYPGELTKVADYNSRNPITCTLDKCQTCKFVQQEISDHEHYVRYTHQGIDENIMLVERPSWLALQKQDKTLIDLNRLIRTGLAPEKKSRDKDLKLLHNMFKRGSLFVATDGLIQVKVADIAHNIDYQPIVVPNVYVASVIQSLHLKLSHPSPYQLHKHMARHFFAIGMAKSINNITSSCDTCSRLKILPKQVHKSTTAKNDTFGTNFSADILIEKGQHILLCREKLSQFSTTCFLENESKQCIEQGIIASLIDMIPDGGAVIQVDAGPGLVALENDKNSSLNSLNIKLDIGRIHNKHKNPIAENAIKEFRKEWLRLKPNGSSLSELDRAKITAIMNKRIRLNGLAPKEFVFKRSMKNHSPLSVDDGYEGDQQFNRRTESNANQLLRDSTKKKIPVEQNLKIGDLVYIIADLSKSRSREQYIVVKCFTKNNQRWIIVRKSQRGLRNKEYLLQASEVFLAPVREQLWSEAEECEADNTVFDGFKDNISLSKRDRLQSIIKSLEKSIIEEKKRGRPAKLRYPDYVQPLSTDVHISEEDEVCYGFGDTENSQAQSKRDSLQQIIAQMESNGDDENEMCYGFSQKEVDEAKEKSKVIENMLAETSSLVAKLRKVKAPQVVNLQRYSWNYAEWLDILEQDFFEEERKPVSVLLNQSGDLEPDEREDMSDGSLDYDYSYLQSDYSEVFHSMTDHERTQGTEHMEDFDTIIEDFNIQFDRYKPSISTPRQEFKSLTDPLMLDKIPVCSSSESDLDQEEEHVGWNIQGAQNFTDLFSTIPEGPVKLDQALEKVHELCPELAKPDPGRVYDMSTILQNIEDTTHKNPTVNLTQSLQVSGNDVPTDSLLEHRPKRTIPRLDYKLLNTKGAAFIKKK